MIRIERDSFIKIGIVILLFIAFFIGLQERYSYIKAAYTGLQIIAVLCILVSERYISRNQHNMPIIALLCIIIILCNRNARISHGSLALDSRICTAFIVYFLACRRTNWYNTLIKSLIVLGAFYGITTIYLYIFPEAYTRYVVPLFGTGMEGIFQKGYVVGFSRHFSTTAIYHAVTLGVSICIFVKKNLFDRRQKILLLTLSIIIYIGVLLTGKRAHSIFIPISVIICYYFFSSDRKINNNIKVLGGILVFLGIFYIGTQIIPSLNNVLIRFQIKMERGDITSGRNYILQDCESMFLDNPLIGKGWGTFTYYTHTGVQNAHNVYAQLLAENGLILSIPFFAFIIGSIVHTTKAIHVITIEKRKIHTSFFVSLIFSLYIQIFFVFYCFTGNPLYDFQYVLPYMLGCAIGENAYSTFVACDLKDMELKSWKTIRSELNE